MAHRLIWSPQAIADIDGIAEYIARDSEIYAAAVAQRLFEAPARLTEFPRLGRVIPETNGDTIREIFVHEYRLMYEIAGEEIYVLAVVHGRRRFTSEMLEPGARECLGERKGGKWGVSSGQNGSGCQSGLSQKCGKVAGQPIDTLDGAGCQAPSPRR